jgi:hypothetical protein
MAANNAASANTGAPSAASTLTNAGPKPLHGSMLIMPPAGGLLLIMQPRTIIGLIPLERLNDTRAVD